LLRASLAPNGTPNMNFRNGAFNDQRGIRDDAAYREYIDGSDRGLAIELANRMRDAIQAVRGRAFAVKSSFELYPTAGTSTDYTFSRHLADASKGKAYSYTIEWGSRDNATPFHPPYSEMQNIIREVTAGLLDFCLSIIELTRAATMNRKA
jgi:carboxypeptidase T